MSRSSGELAAAYCGVMAVAVQNVAPALAGVLHLQLGWGERAIGAFASADALGIFAGNVLAASLLTRCSFRSLTMFGMAVLALANLGSMLSFSPGLLIGARVAGGLGGGLALAVSFSVFAGTHPERGIGAWSVGQLAFGLIGITATPWLVGHFGWRVVFVCLGALALLGVPTARRLSSEPTGARGLASRSSAGPLDLATVIGPLSAGLFYFGQGSLWPYLELIGLRSGIERSSVEASLSLSAASALLGSAAVVLLSRRRGRRWPLFVAFALTLAAIYAIRAPEPKIFRAALATFTFAWPLFGAYQFAVVARASRSVRIGAYITAATFAGTMIGPLLAGAIGSAIGFGGVQLMAVAADVVALACLAPLLRARAARSSSVTSGQ